jgi:hypothetical protein
VSAWDDAENERTAADVRARAIEAGARALHKHDRDAIGATLRCGGPATCSRCRQWASYAAAVVDAVEPIIRADERKRIVREIELDRLALNDVDLDTYSGRDIRIGLSRAARIAAG